jgi:hypothetical protein
MSSYAADGARAAWQSEVDRLVHDSLTAATFADLLERLPGIDPLSVWQSLQRQSTAGDNRAAGLGMSPADPRVAPLPIPHPLNFDWRFTTGTNDELIKRLAAATSRGEVLGYFGAPTTWRKARRALPDRRHVLFDREAERHADADTDAYKVRIGSDPLPAVRLDAALVDPPWYPEYHDSFLAAAASRLSFGNYVFASFPPPLTRPGATAERANIVRNAVRAGLVVADESPLALRYETPPFEEAAFAAAGLGTIPRTWRRGDLLKFCKRSAPNSVVPPLPDEGWRFVVIDEIPLAVRADVAPANTLLAPAITGATLPSVSRRHPARAGAALWSSRNRIYGSREPALLQRVISGLADGKDLPAIAASCAAKEEKVLFLAKEVTKLVRIERKEHGLE